MAILSDKNGANKQCLCMLIAADQVQSRCICAGIKMAWYLLFYLRGVRLLMLALKASTVESCGIRGGKLFHVIIDLVKKLYLNVSMFV